MTPALSGQPMKESGIEWVGKVPAHWSVRPFFSFAAEVDHPNVGLKERNLLSLSYGRLVRKDMDRLEGLTPASFEGYNIVEANDIVFRLTDLQNDMRSLRSARALERGIITSAYVTVRPQAGPRFFEYLMRSYDTTKVFYGIGGGIRQSMKFADLKRLPVVVPPVAEMDSIVAHLDRATTRIDALVAKKIRFIMLLREKREATITHVVTKGLDAAVPIKESGVEWLGNVPAHWEIGAARRFYSFNPSKREISSRHRSQEVSFLPMEAIGETGKLDLTRTRPISEVDTGYSYFANGDVVIAKITPCFENGKGAPVNDLTGGVGFGTTELIVLRPSNLVSQQYSWWLFAATGFRRFAEGHMEGSAGQKRVQDEWLKAQMIALPPLAEQETIVAHLDRATTRIDTLIAKTERSVELLREHRTALITAAVTGRIDLLKAA
ncbi:restriction endonuclease subunit S [Lysobacter sp. HDW10]|uniref:restriction endonuclease subunit S n=1 Tax=Lysobacter sp. HDW10 TaxID=2714936 RepID=UPI0014072E40|nr:restriction endonuclease subunit S [Lysobacter sp. HDW10]QIK80567.1 restriction endonuclease subunit S [Lysobacter sp. HDW10]